MLLIVAVSLNFSGFSGRFNILDSESKERSNALAEACIDRARLVLAVDTSTTASDVEIYIGDETCEYDIVNAGSEKEIYGWSEFNSANTFYGVRVDVNESNIPIICFAELLNASDDLSICP